MFADDVLVRRAMSPRIGTVCTALDEMIRQRRWLLDEPALRVLEARGIAHIAAWLFTYRTMSFPEAERDERIRQGLAADSARIREHACDLAGDLGLAALKDALLGLFDDEDEAVREAARCNAGMLDE